MSIAEFNPMDFPKPKVPNAELREGVLYAAMTALSGVGLVFGALMIFSGTYPLLGLATAIVSSCTGYYFGQNLRILMPIFNP